MIKGGKFIILVKPDVPNGFMCVYKIKFGNRLFYIGSTKCLNQRILTHLSSFKKDYVNTASQKLNLTERDNIIVEILESIDDSINIKEREDFYIERHLNKSGFLNTRTAVTKTIIKIQNLQ